MRWLIFGTGMAAFLSSMRKWAVLVQKKANEKAQTDVSMERLRFLQRLDHELKNPLTAMQIALANLEEANDAEKRREIRASMRSQLLRISYLIGDLRKLATLERGDFERIPVDVGDLLTEVTLVFRDTDEVAQRHFTTDFEPQYLPNLIGDRDMLQLAVYNVLDNAKKFTEPGDAITLHAYTEGDQLVIQVIDTGRGIPAEDVPHIWEDLHRSPDVQGIPGSGVGLSMVRSIIEQHGGTVSATSTFRSKTTITLQLPI